MTPSSGIPAILAAAALDSCIPPLKTIPNKCVKKMATRLVFQAKYVHFGVPRYISPATHTSFLFGFTVTYSFLSSPLQKYFPVPSAVCLQTRLVYPVWPIKKAHCLLKP